MANNMYQTNYKSNFGGVTRYNNTFANTGMSTMAGTQRQPMAQTQPIGMEQTHQQQAQDLYDYQTQQMQEQVPFPYSTANFPERVAVPSKEHFYPKGYRVSYAKGRKTFPKTALIARNPVPQPEIAFFPPTEAQRQSKGNYGKYSISRRQPQGENLRSHLPGYMGQVREIQFKHGDTFGRTTRECIMAPYI